jgi:biopolymer transport protein ExbD
MPKVQSAPPGSGRGSRGRRASSTLAEINVVPLVDVMLVLLIIFMITAPMIQRGIEVTLPESRRSTPVEGERLFITVPAAYREDHTIYLGDEPVPADAFQERVRQHMEEATVKDVFLQGDGTVQLQELIEVIDRLKDAGVRNLGLVTDVPKRR